MNPEEPPQPPLPWYFRPATIWIAVLSFGPLALPLVWLHPRMENSKKIIWTVAVLVATYFLYLGTVEAMKKLEETYRELKAAGF